MRSLWRAAAAVLGMALSLAMAQNLPEVKVDYTFRGQAAINGFRDGDQVWITPELATKWYWTTRLENGYANLIAEGRNLRVQTRQVEGKTVFNLSQVVQVLGAVSRWEGNVYAVRSVLRNVEQTAEGIRIDGTLMTRYRAFKLTGPDRLVIDIAGSVIEKDLELRLPPYVRVGEMEGGVTRVVIEHPDMARQPIPADTPKRRFDVDLVNVGSSRIALPEQTPPPVAPTRPMQQAGQVEGEPARLGAITSANETDTSFDIRIPISRQLPTSPSASYLNPTTIQVLIPGAVAPENSEGNLGSGRFVQRYQIINDGRGNTSLVLYTPRSLAFQVSTNGGQLVVRLFKPRNANGQLNGKVIVIDPGHGGRDPGAVNNGVREKDVVLAVSRRIVAELTALGASVVLTRNDDFFIAVGERPRIANRGNADLFISVHINSNTVANSRSGSIMFYHQQEPLGMLLAELLDDELKKAVTVPSMGIRSDRTIYNSGFGVLRGANMPGVLMELAFINHNRDRATIVRPDYQAAVGKAVARAVQRYFAQ